MAEVTIMGAGSWGLALAILLNNNGHHVNVWSVFPDEVELLAKERENKKCLPGVHIPENIEFSADTEYVVENRMLSFLRLRLLTQGQRQSFCTLCKKGQYIVNVGKGIEEDTLMTLCQVVEQEIPQCTAAVLSGPSHAEEVGRMIPTTCVIGTHKKKMLNIFRIYL